VFRLLRKIKNHIPISLDEKKELILELERLSHFPNPGWKTLFNFYSDDLATAGIVIPLFAVDPDNIYNWLLENPELLEKLKSDGIPAKDYPIEMADYLNYYYGDCLKADDVPELLLFHQENLLADALPIPRSNPPSFKYEEGNPYKESGLKNHFERIARYSFVNRIQSYRYLTAHRASADRFEVVSEDTLSGIFSNKEKSIYYYVYMTERNQQRTENACRLLNQVFYGK